MTPKTYIYQWNHSGINFFAFFSNFTVSSSSSQIFHSSAIFFTSIVLSFLGFSFLPPFSILSSLVSFFFCFCYPSFSCFGLYCFLHSSDYLIIFTSSILQSISELWQASYNIPKIILYFYPLITSISILSLCS